MHAAAIGLVAACAACARTEGPTGAPPLSPEFTLVELGGAPLPHLLGANADGDSLFLLGERLTLGFDGTARIDRRVRDVRTWGLDTTTVQSWAMRYTVRGDSLSFASTLVCIRAPCGPQLRGRRVGSELALLLLVERGWDLIEIPLRYRAAGAYAAPPD